MSRLVRGTRAAVLGSGLALVLGSCGSSFGMLDPASKEGDRTSSLWQVMFLVAIGVGALVWGLIIWSVVRYRRRDPDHIPNQNPYKIKVEVLYTVVPVLMVIAIFVVTVIVQQRNTELSSDPDVTVEVVGFQWEWQFNYPAEDVLVTGGSEIGDPPELVLPEGRTIRLTLASSDVNHSFWVPRFLSKRDLIPGVDNEIDVETTERGTFDGRCAEFCGVDHWRMNFSVRVVTPDEYEAWLTEQRQPEAARPAGPERPLEREAGPEPPLERGTGAGQ